MSTSVEATAAQLRRRLADQLAARGDLRSLDWRNAIEAVPREVFLGDRIYRPTPHDETLWEQVTPADLGEAGWLELAYENTSWVTQLDGHDHEGNGPLQGVPTSSSTLPGLVVAMLEDLQVRDGQRVLEIGTGTGYSTALLCQRLGDQLVTSVEIDERVSARAATALATTGYTPTLITGDGLLGHQAGGPYDRIIATCSVRTIPHTWISQARPSTRILLTLSGWMYGSGLVDLVITADGNAEGRYLPGTVSFMPARAHTPPPIAEFPARDGNERATVHGTEILSGWMGRFLAELAAPHAQRLRFGGNASTSPADLIIDQSTGSYAWLPDQPDQPQTVIQGGPARLWDQIEQTQDLWQAAGRPPQHEFTLCVTPDTATTQLKTPHGTASWERDTA